MYIIPVSSESAILFLINKFIIYFDSYQYPKTVIIASDIRPCAAE